MALVRRDEVLEKALSTDETAVPRFNIIGEDGSTIYQNVRLELANRVVTPGTPINKIALDEILAASGVTGGTATAYTLAQENYVLTDGAEVRFRLHTASGSGATLNVNGTGAKPLRDAMGRSLINGIPAGVWLTATYSAVAGAYGVDGGTGAVPYLATYYPASTAISADDLTDPFALIPVGTDINADLYNILGGVFAYVYTSFYNSTAVTSRRMQIAVTYDSINPKMAIRLYGTNGWVPWCAIADTNYALATDGSNAMKATLNVMKENPVIQLWETASGSAGTLQQAPHRTTLTSNNVKGNGANARAIRLMDSAGIANVKDALSLLDTVGGVTTYYTILHTGNKNLIAPADIGAPTTAQAAQIAAAQAKVISTTRITTAATQIDIPIPSGYTRYRLIAAGLSVDYSQEDNLETGVFNLRVKATAQTVASRVYAWEIGGSITVITSPDISNLTTGEIGSVPASRSANSAYMQMEIFKNGDDWAGTLNGNGSSYDGTSSTPSGFCYATFTASEISTLSLVCSYNITAGMILLEGLA